MTEKKVKSDIIKYMKVLGTYKIEFTQSIETLTKIIVDKDMAEKAFKNSGGELIVEHTNKSGATNIVKNPYYLIIEQLRQVEITYLRELGLTPSGLKKINDKAMGKKKTSPLAKALKEIG